MRFSLKRRILSLLWGSWLALLFAEPRVLHVCAVHADGMSHAGAEPGHTSRSASMLSHGPGHRQEHSTKCTCLGVSSHANAVVIPSAQEKFVADSRIVVTPQLFATADAPPPVASPFFLPYPNGPPVAIAS
jgi:hypothetical protein